MCRNVLVVFSCLRRFVNTSTCWRETTSLCPSGMLTTTKYMSVCSPIHLFTCLSVWSLTFTLLCCRTGWIQRKRWRSRSEVSSSAPFLRRQDIIRLFLIGQFSTAVNWLTGYIGLTVSVKLFLPLCLPGVPWNFSFNVKFYPPDPAQLSEDISR